MPPRQAPVHSVRTLNCISGTYTDTLCSVNDQAPPPTSAPAPPPSTEAPVPPPTTEAPAPPSTTEAPAPPPTTTEAPAPPPTTPPNNCKSAKFRFRNKVRRAYQVAAKFIGKHTVTVPYSG